MRHNSGAPAPILDLHVHSTCSVDSEAGIRDYVRRARDLGLVEIGFCEHVDLDPRDMGYGHTDPARYDREIASARAEASAHADASAYAEGSGLQIRQGIELNYQSGREDEVRAWMAVRPWDYVVSSVHLVDYVDGWAIVSEPGAMKAYFTTHTQRQAYLPYFEELLRAARSGLGDVLGHLDLIKRYGVIHYGPFDPAAYEDEIRAVLRAAVESGMGLEINTSGLRQSPGEPYPALPVLRWYREEGGEVLTAGSDAHQAGDLGAGIAEGLEMARAAGFRAVATFEQRQVRWIDLQ